MPDLSRGDRAELEAALAELDLGPDGELVMDGLGPACYRLDPIPARCMTALLCLPCRHTSLIPSIPRKPRLSWTCSSCKREYPLAPPAKVWIEGSRPMVIT